MRSELWLVLLGVAALSARLGLCLYLSGMSRAKNAGTAVARAVADLCLSVLAFWAIGNAVLGGSLHRLIGLHGSFGAIAFFNAIIILIATGAALGGMSGRTYFAAPLAGSLLLAGLIVPLAGRWAWSGWLHELGFIDVGGASVLHLCGGLCAAAGAMVAGPRLGKYNHDGSVNLVPGHSVPQATIGILMIMAGLIPQIVGCAILQRSPAPQAAVDALLAATAGGLAAMILGRRRYATTDLHFANIGLLAGVVAVSASAGRLPDGAAVCIGGVAGLVSPMAMIWIDLRRKIDDPGSGIAIHAVGGAWGLLAAGLFVQGDRLRQLAVQAVGATAIGALAFAASLAVFLLLRKRLRLSEADELDGSDLVEHDLNAYPDFQQTMIKSYHLRET